MRSLLLRFCAAGAVSLICSSVTLAHSGHDRTEEGRLELMVGESRLVFLGEVADVDYRVQASEGKERIPVTYVTYKIDKLVRGKAESRTLTMRFLGGTDGRGHFLTLSNTPRFMKGERDLLLVRGNGSDGCPLVNCEDGRFRVLEGGVYNAHGVPVRAVVKQGVIARGSMRKEFAEFRYPAPSFDALMKNPEVQKRLSASGMSMEEARRKFQAEAPKAIVVRAEVVDRKGEAKRERKADKGDDRGAIPETKEPLQEGPIAVEEFIKHITEISQRVGGRLEPLHSIDPERAGALSAAKQAAPAKEPRRDDASEEAEMLRNNDGNPVLKTQ